ncbi:cell wall biogenesis protein [Candidatus Parcubacteria bacterium]|nr:MAG: cell wall biogenesis protein [Candidatus Parcubacteria bacterium]
MKYKLALFGGQKTILPEKARFNWPVITDEVEAVVMKQLHESVSIYNRSGIFEEFENNFADYHGRKKGLLFNSGTSAIYSMFEGIGLGPGDEVICPTYTLFATVSPMMMTGARPVFCDCREDGNINPDEIVKKITAKTKAVIVTHMWGIPCQMDVISEICSQHKLALLEDCSHAHGASYQGRKVGTFGSAAAWSLQGQKIISGGEGGIMLTDTDSIYNRALLLGHYNKRCKQEIPESFQLSGFSQTGFGQKFRAHPLAIAMANQQFSHLDEWVCQKSQFAKQYIAELGSCRFLTMPQFHDSQPSWYAFVMQYNEASANGVKIEKFVEALQAEGLSEVDMPGSTCPIHNLPLFVAPEQVFPRLYENKQTNISDFPIAEKFYNLAIKIPVWAFPQDAEVVVAYIKGFQKVISVVENEPKTLT